VFSEAQSLKTKKEERKKRDGEEKRTPGNYAMAVTTKASPARRASHGRGGESKRGVGRKDGVSYDEIEKKRGIVSKISKSCVSEFQSGSH